MFVQALPSLLKVADLGEAPELFISRLRVKMQPTPVLNLGVWNFAAPELGIVERGMRPPGVTVGSQDVWNSGRRGWAPKSWSSEVQKAEGGGGGGGGGGGELGWTPNSRNREAGFLKFKKSRGWISSI